MSYVRVSENAPFGSLPPPSACPRVLLPLLAAWAADSRSAAACASEGGAGGGGWRTGTACGCGKRFARDAKPLSTKAVLMMED